VWEDHLLPLLTCGDAARLGSTCKALRVVVRERFTDLGVLYLRGLRPALTSFPKARTVEIEDYNPDWEDAQAEEMVEWMREGGHGRYLTRLAIDRYEDDGAGLNFFQKALQAGVLPSLERLDADLARESHRASMTDEGVGAVNDLRLRVSMSDDHDVEVQLAALSLVRQLPALARLEVSTCLSGQLAGPMRWSSFIPRSVKALRLDMSFDDCPASDSLLGALPGLLRASDTRLERLEVKITGELDSERFDHGLEWLVRLTQAVRHCSPTLKCFRLESGDGGEFTMYPDEESVTQEERVRVHWADVLAGVSSCRELQVLILPFIPLEPLFPPGTVFGRLTRIEIIDRGREHPPDAGVMGLWELMASGGLPALTELKVWLEKRWGGVEEVKTRVVPAFEAVARTLTFLFFLGHWGGVGVGYELGVAMGKLRRLKDLALDLSQDGRFHHAFAEGLAASGGERPLPLLWRVILPSGVKRNADLTVSLLLPSVRAFSLPSASTRGTVLMACALRAAGYKHAWAVDCDSSIEDDIQKIASCSLGHNFAHDRNWVYPPE
jgi:hypothetical protein